MAGDLPYRVLWPPPVIAQLKKLIRKAQQAGVGKELAQSIRTIDERLRGDPLDFGEI